LRKLQHIHPGWLRFTVVAADDCSPKRSFARGWHEAGVAGELLDGKLMFEGHVGFEGRDYPVPVRPDTADMIVMNPWSPRSELRRASTV